MYILYDDYSEVTLAAYDSLQEQYYKAYIKESCQCIVIKEASLIRLP